MSYVVMALAFVGLMVVFSPVLMMAWSVFNDLEQFTEIEQDEDSEHGSAPCDDTPVRLSEVDWLIKPNEVKDIIE